VSGFLYQRIQILFLRDFEVMPTCIHFCAVGEMTFAC